MNTLEPRKNLASEDKAAGGAIARTLERSARPAGFLAFCAAAALLAMGARTVHGDAGCGNPDATGPCPTCPEEGDPCAETPNALNAVNGNVTRSITDLTVWGAVGDRPLAFTRHASSRMGTGTKWFGQAQNWRHSYQFELVASSGVMDVYRPDGKVWRYTNYDGHTWWRAPANAPEWLRQAGDDAYLSTPDYTVMHFRRYAGSPAYWLLLDITDPSGNQTMLTYDAERRLIQVTEPAGRWLKISYGGISVDQSRFSVLASVQGTPPRAWSELAVTDNTAYRYLRYYSTNTGSGFSYGNIAEMEFYDKAGNKLTGTPFGNGPSWGNNPSTTYAAASDGNINTFYDYAYPNFGFTGIDLGAGNAKAIGKIRFHPRIGYEARMAAGGNDFGMPGCRFEGSNAGPLTLDAIRRVESSDGRAVNYDYDTVPDPVLPQSWLVLGAVRYGDGPPAETETASYRYSLVFAGQPPLLSEANDPRYAGAGVHMKYTYWSSAIYGSLRQELNGRTGSVLVTLDGAGAGTNQVTYANGYWDRFTQAPNGKVSKRTDALGRTWNYAYGTGNAGFLSASTDAAGRTTAYTREAAGRPTSETRPDGSVLGHTYDSAGRVLTETLSHPGNPAFTTRTTRWTRDPKGRITRTDHPDASYETFTYNAFGQVLTHTLRNGGSESFAYDARGLKTSHTDALGGVTTFAYNASDLLESVHHGPHATSYAYNERGQLLNVTHPDRSTVSYTYNTYGNRLTMTNELGKTWAYTYDEFKRLVTSTDPLGNTTTYTYAISTAVCGSCHSDDQPTQITLPSGKIIKIAYDLAGRKISETVGLGSADAATTSYAYDAANNLTTITDPRGKVWTYTYDNRNRRSTAKDPLNNTTSWTYDAAGNRLTEIRPDNGVTTNTYDALNRLVTTKDPKNQTTTFTYGGTSATTKGDNLITLTDARNQTTTFAYDLLDRRTRKTYADGSHEDWSYNDHGQVATYTTPAGQVKTSTYDDRGRETSSEWSGNSAPEVSRTYDQAGRLLTLNNGLSALSYTYDDANRLLSETQDLQGPVNLPPKTVRYSYDADGNRAGMTYPSGTTMAYAYTARNQLSTITADGPPPLASYSYDLNGNRTGKTLENGTSAAYAYDHASRLLSVTHRKGASVFQQFDYALNAVGNRTNRTEANAGAAAQLDVYGYDAIDQVTNVKYAANAATNPSTFARQTSYDYDPAGNRQSVIEDTDGSGGGAAATTPYTADNLNQYTSIDALAAPQYDANGNTAVLQTSGSGPVWTYSYDAQNRLTGGTSSAGGSFVFAYDARHRCVARTISGTTTANLYDDWNLIEERTPADALSAKHIHGAALDEILCTIREAGGTDVPIFHHHDGLGSVTALTDYNGTLTERYTYDIYGLPTIYDPAETILPASAVNNRFLFTGREWLADLKLNDHRHRYYQPEAGRWLSRDPLGFSGGINLYTYGMNRPTLLRDCFGQIPLQEDSGGRPINEIELNEYDYQPSGRECCENNGGSWVPTYDASGFDSFTDCIADCQKDYGGSIAGGTGIGAGIIASGMGTPLPPHANPGFGYAFGNLIGCGAICGGYECVGGR